jgi:hypothetical protein
LKLIGGLEKKCEIAAGLKGTEKMSWESKAIKK